MEFVLRPKDVARFFAWIVAGLALAHLMTQVFRLFYRDDQFFGLVFVFDLDNDGNLPALIYSVILLITATLFILVAIAAKRQARPYVLQWLGLATVFLILFLEESVKPNERLVQPTLARLNIPGDFSVAPGIVPGIALLLVFLLYFRYFVHLPPRTRLLYLITASCYLASAYLFGRPAMIRKAVFGSDGLYLLMRGGERIVEITGAVILIYALIAYLAEEFQDLRLRIRSTLEETVIIQDEQR